MNWEAIKPLAVLIFTSLLKIIGGALMAHGLLTAGVSYETFIGVATTAGGAVWSWWVQSGHLQAAAYLKKLTDTATQAAAIEVAKKMAPASVTGAAQDAKTAVAVAAVAKVLIVAFALSIFLANGSAMAQIKLRAPAVTGNPAADLKTDLSGGTSTSSTGANGLLTPDALIKKIIALSSPDLAYAAAMATAANTNAATVRLGCVKAIQTLNAQASGASLKNPDGSPMTMPAEPHIFTDLETIAEGIDSLSPTGPLYTSCAGAAALAQTNVLAFINAVVSGTAAAALVVPK